MKFTTSSHRNVDTIIRLQGSTLTAVLASAVRYNWSWVHLVTYLASEFDVEMSDTTAGKLLTQYRNERKT